MALRAVARLRRVARVAAPPLRAAAHPARRVASSSSRGRRAQEDPGDIFLTRWNGTILGPPGCTHEVRRYESSFGSVPRARAGQRVGGLAPWWSVTARARCAHYSLSLSRVLQGRLYSLSIVCGPNYPLEPPVVSFLSKVAIKCVDGAGRVDVNKVLKGRSGWGRDLDIAAVLSSIRADMVSPDNRRTPQPPEGSCY